MTQNYNEKLRYKKEYFKDTIAIQLIGAGLARLRKIVKDTYTHTPLKIYISTCRFYMYGLVYM